MTIGSPRRRLSRKVWTVDLGLDSAGRGPGGRALMGNLLLAAQRVDGETSVAQWPRNIVKMPPSCTRRSLPCHDAASCR